MEQTWAGKVPVPELDSYTEESLLVTLLSGMRLTPDMQGTC